MATEKQDSDSWRRRIDKKLNILWKGHEELSARLDLYTKNMDTNTAITKEINKKVDALVDSTGTLVEIVQRARWTARMVRWVAKAGQGMVEAMGRMSAGIVAIFTVYYVVEHSKDWAKSFVNIFNGNLN